jgi:hypothetical protein
VTADRWDAVKFYGLTGAAIVGMFLFLPGMLDHIGVGRSQQAIILTNASFFLILIVSQYRSAMITEATIRKMADDHRVMLAKFGPPASPEVRS